MTVPDLSNQAVATPSAKVIEQVIPDLITERAGTFGVSKDLALAIAFCESTYRQYDPNKKAEDGTPVVLRGVHNPADVGIFQINETYHLEKSKELGYNIYTPEGNINYGLWLLKNEGSRHWNWSKPCWSPRLDKNT